LLKPGDRKLKIENNNFKILINKNFRNSKKIKYCKIKKNRKIIQQSIKI
jgi:hypothetical protein